MDKKRKKEKMFKSCFTFVWFVFCVLSFFVYFKETTHAEIVRYEYVFDMGPSSGGYVDDGSGVKSATIEKMKMVLTVEEDLEYEVSNANRYSITNREIIGYVNYGTGKMASEGGAYVTGLVSNEIGVSLYTDDNKTIYNFLSYVAFSTDSNESRKLMKSILFSAYEQGWKIKVEENGWRNYIGKGVIDDNKSHNALGDGDYPSYVWLEDKEWNDVDFKEFFHKKQQSEFTAFSPKYVKKKMKIIKDEEEYDFKSFFNNDLTILKIINLQIEKDDDLGKFLKNYKKELTPMKEAEEYTWSLREGSYDAEENSIIIDVNQSGKNEFSFKYSPNKKFRGAESEYRISVASDEQQNYDYEISISYTGSGTSIEKHLEVSNNQSSVETEINLSTHFSMQEDGKVKANEDFFAAISTITTTGNGVDTIYVTKFEKDSYKSFSGNAYQRTGRVLGKKVCTIYEQDLKDIIKANGGSIEASTIDVKENNGYVFELNKDNKTISFYKKGDDTYVGMNIYVREEDFYAIWLTKYENSIYNNMYGLSLEADPTSKDGQNPKLVSTTIDGVAQDRLPTLVNTGAVRNLEGKLYSDEWTRQNRMDAMFYWMYENSSNDAILCIYDLNSKDLEKNKRGLNKGSTIDLNECDIIAQVSIRDWLEELHPELCEKGINNAESTTKMGTLTGDINDLNEMMPKLGSFYVTLLDYSKPIFMFLVFISIIYVGIMALIENGNAEKRVLLKEKLLHISYGILFFATALLVIAIGTKYFFEVADMIAGISDSVEIEYDGFYTADDNWIMNIIEEIIKAITSGIEWITDKITARMLLLGVKEVNLAEMLFGVESVGGVTLYPFAEAEWNAYMYGYKMLATLAIALIAIALVKIIGEMFINAGNLGKIAAVKDDLLRIIVAIISIVLVPYAFRIVLTLINSLVLMIPVSETKFDLNFDNYGLVGSVAGLVYATVELKIFLVFVVRKIMMAFLLIATPVIFGIWAISKKFRSFSLWLGELMTNAFMQFSYAFVFFFLVIVLANEQNPFVILLLITMIMKLSDFIRDSLQGLFGQMGGINETAVANQAYNMGANAAKKTVNAANTTRKAVGIGMMKASNRYDEKGLSKGGKLAYNVGALVSGNFGKMRTERTRINNIAQEYSSEYSKNYRKMYTMERKLGDKIGKNDVLAGERFNKAKYSNLTEEEILALEEQGGVYSEIAEYAKLVNKAENSKSKMYRAKEAARKFDTSLPYLDESSDETMKRLEEDGALTKESYDEMMKIYQENVKKMNEESSQGKDGKLKNIAEKVVKQAAQLSEMSIRLEIDNPNDRSIIRSGQKAALRTVSKTSVGDATFGSKFFDMQDTVNNNFKKYDEIDKKYEEEKIEKSEKTSAYMEEFSEINSLYDENLLTEEEHRERLHVLNTKYPNIFNQ